ncbi:MAG: endolytic transglycosylase MltG [Bryobacterales bacterium]
MSASPASKEPPAPAIAATLTKPPPLSCSRSTWPSRRPPFEAHPARPRRAARRRGHQRRGVGDFRNGRRRRRSSPRLSWWISPRSLQPRDGAPTRGSRRHPLRHAFHDRPRLALKDVLQAGEYQFAQPVSVWDAFESSPPGPCCSTPSPCLKGSRASRSPNSSKRQASGSADAFLALTADPAPMRDIFPAAESLEGCLFPETYSFPRNTAPEKVLDAMLRGFRVAFDEAKRGSDSKLGPYEALTMASLIEKETGVDEERPLVSSVYYNRIRLGMLLQCDPTIIYGLILDDRYRGKIYESDIRDPHDYNTYVHPGLPPGPIANPGLASLKAAFHPADSDYLYFVAESAGKPSHIFSKNLQAHNKAVAQYRRTLR